MRSARKNKGRTKRQNNMQTKSNTGVGYGRPPMETRFKPGTSGNPSGRPKGARSLKTDLLHELAESTEFNDSGITTTVTKQLALVKTLVKNAIAGEPRAMNTVLTICLRLFSDLPDDDALSADDQAIMSAFSKRPTKASAAPPETGATGAKK
jgi:hypothetical protein